MDARKRGQVRNRGGREGVYLVFLFHWVMRMGGPLEAGRGLSARLGGWLSPKVPCIYLAPGIYSFFALNRVAP
jgi:hypothetical protein